jgi:FeS assembly SUF system protein
MDTDNNKARSLESQVEDTMRTIYDPEIPVNIFELGLVYEIDVDENKKVKISMTLTSPNCPVAESLPGEVEYKVQQIPGVSDVEVEIVWDPPWTTDMMSEAAKLQLGFM